MNVTFVPIIMFQHPFIRGELDPKPVRDLLLEYKADVVEEEVVDEDAEVIFLCQVLSCMPDITRQVQFFYITFIL